MLNWKKFWPTFLAALTMFLDTFMADAVVQQYLANNPQVLAVVIVIVTAVGNAVNPRKKDS